MFRLRRVPPSPACSAMAQAALLEFCATHDPNDTGRIDRRSMDRLMGILCDEFGEAFATVKELMDAFTDTENETVDYIGFISYVMDGLDTPHPTASSSQHGANTGQEAVNAHNLGNEEADGREKSDGFGEEPCGMVV